MSSNFTRTRMFPSACLDSANGLSAGGLSADGLAALFSSPRSTWQQVHRHVELTQWSLPHVSVEENSAHHLGSFSSSSTLQQSALGSVGDERVGDGVGNHASQVFGDGKAPKWFCSTCTAQKENMAATVCVCVARRGASAQGR